MSRETERPDRPRRHGIAARHLTACAGALALLLAACGSDDGAAERQPDVNPVEAVMAIDDVRVAGVPLGPAPPTGTVPAAAAAPAGATRRAGDSAPRPVAQLQPGAPLVVDMEVADATAGSEVGVVWYAPDGRERWRQKRPVGDEPRLAFSADTTGWPAGLYRGEIRYGRVPVHQFAVQVGTPAPRMIVRERFPAPGAVAGGALSGQQTARAAAPDSPSVPSDSATGREAAAERAAAAASARDEAAAAGEPATAVPVEILPVEEGAPVERVPPDDPNMVVPEGPPGPAPETPPEPDEDDEGDEGDEGDDEPPPRRRAS